MASNRINLILCSIFAAYLIISVFALNAEAGKPEGKKADTSGRTVLLVDYEEAKNGESGKWIITDTKCFEDGNDKDCKDSKSTSKKSASSSSSKKSTKRIAEVQLKSNGVPSTKADLKLLDLLKPKKV